MDILEIIQKQSEFRRELNDLYDKEKELNKQLSNFNSLYNTALMEEFLDYLKVGDQFTTDKNHFSLSKEIHFLREGETIKIIKKNKKTVIIEYIRVMTFGDGTTKTNPITSKVDVNKLFNVYNSEAFKNILITRNTRRKRLEQLGI
jgi:hypothetical protein